MDQLTVSPVTHAKSIAMVIEIRTAVLQVLPIMKPHTGGL